MTVLLLLASMASAMPGDAARGQALAQSRSQGLCVLCHALPGVPVHQSGNLGPDLAGVASRLSAAQRRERLLSPQRHNPDTIMPAYGEPQGAALRVASARRGQPLLDAQGLEDVLAYLETLR